MRMTYLFQHYINDSKAGQYALSQSLVQEIWSQELVNGIHLGRVQPQESQLQWWNYSGEDREKGQGVTKNFSIGTNLVYPWSCGLSLEYPFICQTSKKTLSAALVRLWAMREIHTLDHYDKLTISKLLQPWVTPLDSMRAWYGL